MRYQLYVPCGLQNYLWILAAVIALASCKETPKTSISGETSTTTTATSPVNHLGKKLIETQCYTCHNPKASEESMIAPPMVAIKKHYITDTTTKEQFAKDLIAWINNPDAEPKMKGAVPKFGRMPFMPYPDSTVVRMANYIYDTTLEQPAWFNAHYEQEHGKGLNNGVGKTALSPQVEDVNVKRGMQYALAAKGALGKNLMKALSNKGAVGALEFCTIKAIPLTDSIAHLKNAQIRRVSDKPRNVNNSANEEELGYISQFKASVAQGNETKPIVKEVGETIHFYFPITTNAMCLQCHGKPKEQVQPATMAKLQELYPSDMALGYDTNEVRGIWAIRFDKK